MDKYIGMNKVDVKVTANKEVVKSGEGKRGGFLKTLLLQSVIAAVLGGALFGAKLMGGAGLTFAQKVKEAVCFNATQYVRLLVNG